MSARIDEFCDSMLTALDGIEARAEGAKADIAAARQDGVDGFARKLHAAEQAVADQRDRVDAAGTKVRNWVDGESGPGDAAMRGWRDNMERGRLLMHADLAEASAHSAMIIAEAAIADAALATYQAIAARQHAATVATP